MVAKVPMHLAIGSDQDPLVVAGLAGCSGLLSKVLSTRTVQGEVLGLAAGRACWERCLQRSSSRSSKEAA